MQVRISTPPEFRGAIVELEVVENGVSRGAMQLNRRTNGDYEVGIVEVQPGARRHGIGTKLYEGAALVACLQGTRLVSDTFRSVFAEAFWRKQAKKGRAVCIDRSPAGTYHAPVFERERQARLNCRAAQPFASEHDIRRCTRRQLRGLLKRLPKPKEDSWSCGRWALKPSVCRDEGTVDLSGLKAKAARPRRGR